MSSCRFGTLALLAALALAGCGGGNSDPQFTRENVSESMTALHRRQLENGATMDPLECVIDGDQYHWKCIARVRKDEQLFTLTTNVTCDAGNGQCISEPQALTPA